MAFRAPTPPSGAARKRKRAGSTGRSKPTPSPTDKYPSAKKAAKKAPLGEGSRFKAVEASARRSGARNPAAVAAAAGIKKYGKSKMAKMAAAGRRRK